MNSRRRAELACWSAVASALLLAGCTAGTGPTASPRPHSPSTEGTADARATATATAHPGATEAPSAPPTAAAGSATTAEECTLVLDAITDATGLAGMAAVDEEMTSDPDRVAELTHQMGEAMHASVPRLAEGSPVATRSDAAGDALLAFSDAVTDPESVDETRGEALAREVQTTMEDLTGFCRAAY